MFVCDGVSQITSDHIWCYECYDIGLSLANNNILALLLADDHHVTPLSSHWSMAQTPASDWLSAGRN